jgi:hypothetical protein
MSDPLTIKCLGVSFLYGFYKLKIMLYLCFTMTKKQIFRTMFFEMILKLKNEKITMTKLGSIDYLLYGPRPSSQSVRIKIGNRLETLLNEFSGKMGFPTHKLGKNLIDGHQVDSLFVIDECFEYSEQKTNANLDSEKIKATIKKINKIGESLSMETKKDVKCSIFHTTVWEELDAPDYSTPYSTYRKSGIQIKFMSDYFQSLGVEMTKEEFYSMWREAGEILSKR